MFLVTSAKVTAASIIIVGSHAIFRLVWNILSYRVKYASSDYAQIPWIWDETKIKPRSWFWKAMPVLMKFSKTGGLLELNMLLRDPATLKFKPIVFAGPSISFDPTVMIGDSKIFGKIFNDPVGFPKYKPLYNLYKALIGTGLVISEGETHRTQRKTITPIFHFGALKSARIILERNAKEFVEKELPAQGFVLRQGTFKFYTLNVIVDYAFSGSFDKASMSRTWHSILSHFPTQNLMRVFLGDLVAYLPSPVSVLTLLMYRRIRAYLAQRRLTLAARNLTHDTVLKAAAGDAPDAPAPSPSAGPDPAGDGPPPDISIDLGLNLADQLLLAGCPHDRIADECTTFLFAGEDTTASLLGWAAYELSRAPAEQALVRAELAAVLGPGPVHSVPIEAVPSLARVAAVLKEALRLWPPVGIVTRENRRPDFVVGGLRVPVGAAVDVSIRAAHRDPDIWPEAEEFRPARWLLPADSEEVARRHPYAFVPFIAGPRNCIGQRFAMQEAAVMLAMLLSRQAPPARAGAGRWGPDWILRSLPRHCKCGRLAGVAAQPVLWHGGMGRLGPTAELHPPPQAPRFSASAIGP